MYLDEWVSINSIDKVYFCRKRDVTKSHILEWMPYLSRSMEKKKEKKRVLIRRDNDERL